MRGTRGALPFALLLAACAPAGERPAASAAADTTVALSSTLPPADSAHVTPKAPSTAADSLRGIAERIGNEPRTQLIVRTPEGRACVVQSAEPLPVEGLDVVVWGAPRPETTPLPGVSCTVRVDRYAVRAVDGVRASDGVLRKDGTSYALELSSGTRYPLSNVPSALRSQVGARIYWAGPLDRAPAAYGVLVPAR